MGAEPKPISEIVTDAKNWAQEWPSTRHCPECGATSLRVHSDDPTSGGWCSTYCAECGHHLRTDRLDAPVWEDAAWARSGEQ